MNINMKQLVQVGIFDAQKRHLGIWFRLYDLKSDKWRKLGSIANGVKPLEACMVCGRTVGELDFYDNLCDACAADDDGAAE